MQVCMLCNRPLPERIDRLGAHFSDESWKVDRELYILLTVNIHTCQTIYMLSFASTFLFFLTSIGAGLWPQFHSVASLRGLKKSPQGPTRSFALIVENIVLPQGRARNLASLLICCFWETNGLLDTWESGGLDVMAMPAVQVAGVLDRGLTVITNHTTTMIGEWNRLLIYRQHRIPTSRSLFFCTPLMSSSSSYSFCVVVGCWLLVVACRRNRNEALERLKVFAPWTLPRAARSQEIFQLPSPRALFANCQHQWRDASRWQIPTHWGANIKKDLKRRGEQKQTARQNHQIFCSKNEQQTTNNKQVSFAAKSPRYYEIGLLR